MILDERALAAWGETLGREAPRPAFFALRGELGAGKSVLARAIARGAGVVAVMPSPTFNLLLRYETADGTTVTHIDLYRLRAAEDVWQLGWDELGVGNEIVIIEWPERAEALLPPTRWDISLVTVSDAADVRDVGVDAVGGAAPLPLPQSGHAGPGGTADRAGAARGDRNGGGGP